MNLAGASARRPLSDLGNETKRPHANELAPRRKQTKSGRADHRVTGFSTELHRVGNAVQLRQKGVANRRWADSETANQFASALAKFGATTLVGMGVTSTDRVDGNVDALDMPTSVEKQVVLICIRCRRCQPDLCGGCGGGCGRRWKRAESAGCCR